MSHSLSYSSPDFHSTATAASPDAAATPGSNAFTPDDITPGGIAQGTLVSASLPGVALPGVAFHPAEFDVDLSQTSLAEADELLKSTLEEAMRVVDGNRAFLTLVDTQSGEMVLRFTAGEGWTEETRRLHITRPLDGDLEGSSLTAANGHSNGQGAQGGAPATGARTGITRHVAANGRRYWTGDVSRDPYYIGVFPDVQSEIAVPITARGGGTIGAMNVESPHLDAFQEAHANLLSALARRIAVIVAMAEHQLREEALIAVGKDLSSTAEFETMMRHVVVQATKILRADDCSLFLMDEDAERLQLAASHGPLGEQAGRREARYALGEGLTGWVAQHGATIRVGDPRTDPRWKGLFMEAPAGELAAVMAVPVRGHNAMTGVLRVVRHRKGPLGFLPQEFTQADEDVLTTLAGQLAVAIDRTRLLERLLNTERMAAWGEMSARSAHMIGNAVFGIKGHFNELSHALQKQGSGFRVSGVETSPNPKPETLNPELLLEDITRGIYRLEAILGEFRDFVLATQLQTTPHDINHVVRSVTTESFPRNSNVDLVLNLTPDLPPVLADEAKLKRAFSELIENSIDFQPHGGMLTIRTTRAEAETVRDLTRQQMPGPVVQIEFIDHGPGLSEQDRERVFTPFYTRKAKGMGLGLSIVKGIVEAHHGIIREIGTTPTTPGARARDLPGGAHFVILLPAQATQAALPAQSTHDSGQSI